MNKFNISKGFAAGALALVCVVIFGVCVFGRKEKAVEFTTDPVPLAPFTEAWPEGSDRGAAEGNRSSGALVWERNTDVSGDGQSVDVSEETQAPEGYPVTAEGSPSETVIHFTDPAPAKAPPPETLGTASDHVDHDQTPIPQPVIEEALPDQPKPGAPAPGSRNDKGEVYDPVFGWFTPGIAISEPTDSEGDLNKMVGEM